MYRETSPTLVSALDLRLSPHGFAIVEPDEASRSLGIVRGYHRKTWNTNRAVFLARPAAEGAQGLRAYVEALEANQAEACAHLASMLERPRFEKTSEFLMGDPKILSRMVKYIQGISID